MGVISGWVEWRGGVLLCFEEVGFGIFGGLYVRGWSFFDDYVDLEVNMSWLGVSGSSNVSGKQSLARGKQ